jgi:hypothetical protein
MNRRNESKVANGKPGGRVKFRYSDGERYMDFEMDGATETLADGLRSLASALTQTSAASRHARTLSPARQATPATEASVPQEELPFSDDVNIEQTPGDETPREPAEASLNDLDRARRRPAPRTPQILSDVDLTSGPVPLKQFVEQKSPKELLEKYTVIAAWFKTHRKLDDVTADHIYTCFKFLEWPSPDDVGQPLRDLKSKKKWFDKGAGKGAYKINFIGINSVDKMGGAN